MPLLPKNKIAFVTPWFGETIPGGAESETRALIDHFKPFFDIEVLTTCVKDFHSNWNKNFWKKGVYQEMSIIVRRFKVRPRDTFRFDQINAKLMAHQSISEAEELIYINESIRSLDLNHYLEKNQTEYQWFMFIPYMFGTTVDGISITKSKSVLIPCLHDESYAYLDIYKTMVDNVGYTCFHVPAEKRLAETIFGLNPKFKIVGEGVNTDIISSKGVFKKKHNLNQFILCAGRKDFTKNTPELVAFFDRFQKEMQSDLKLVLIGSGQIDLPKNDNIIDLGFISKEDQYNAMADALCLCNPSHNESFSIVLMESWLCGRPAIVSGDCAVTKDHVKLSNGGLFYDDYHTFSECLVYLQDHPKEVEVMGRNGKEYVSNNFNWNTIIQNYLNALRD